MITINTVDDVKKLLKEKEQRDLEALRANLRITSLQDSHERLEQIHLTSETLVHMLEEAYILYNDDEPNVELAIDQAHKLEQLEAQHDRATRAWYQQIKRIEWERRQASK